MTYDKNTLIKLVVCIFLILIIIFRNNYSYIVSYISSFILIYILVDFTIKNVILSICYTLIIWLLLYIIFQNYSYPTSTIHLNERFENESESESQGQDQDKKERVSHLKEIIKKLEGGIALTKDDLIEKNNINDYDFKKSKVSPDEDYNIKDKNINELTPREAQKETFELINTVKQLKDTVNELAPVLKQGKSILSSLSALKI